MLSELQQDDNRRAWKGRQWWRVRAGLVVDGLKNNCLCAVSGKKRLGDGLFGVVDWDFVGMSEEGLGLLLISENIEGETGKRGHSLE